MYENKQQLVIVEYNKKYGRTLFKLKNREDYINFIDLVSRMIGYWDKDFIHLGQGTHMTPHPSTVQPIKQDLYVHCDCLEYQIVGDSCVPLLCHIFILASGPISRKFNNPFSILIKWMWTNNNCETETEITMMDRKGKTTAYNRRNRHWPSCILE